MRIIILESDKLLADNLAKSLSGAGHEAKWCVDPQSAIDAIDEQLPAAVIMDLLLAERSGMEFLYELRSYPEWQNLPVIIYSGVSDEELAVAPEDFAQLGISAYHYKPATTLAQITASVASVLTPAAA